MEQKIVKTIADAVRPLLDARAKTDKDFAADYKRKDKSVEDFCKLFYDACSKNRNGSHAVFGSDDALIAQAVHYFHEGKVTADDIDLGEISIVKSETKTKTKSGTPAKSASAKKKTPTPTPVKFEAVDEEDEFDFD